MSPPINKDLSQSQSYDSSQQLSTSKLETSTNKDTTSTITTSPIQEGVFMPDDRDEVLPITEVERRSPVVPVTPEWKEIQRVTTTPSTIGDVTTPSQLDKIIQNEMAEQAKPKESEQSVEEPDVSNAGLHYSNYSLLSKLVKQKTLNDNDTEVNAENGKKVNLNELITKNDKSPTDVDGNPSVVASEAPRTTSIWTDPGSLLYPVLYLSVYKVWNLCANNWK